MGTDGTAHGGRGIQGQLLGLRFLVSNSQKHHTTVTTTNMSWIRPREGKHKYPLIDCDPHASRVVRYMRPSDYATWAAYTAGTPAAFWAWGGFV